MIKKELYPKTQRVKENLTVYLTEKLDGSNLVFFKRDNELYIAQRTTIFSLAEIEEIKGKLYKGLFAWLQEHGKALKDNLHEGAAVCGEWIGMGHVKYENTLDKKFYMFAKANIDDNFDLYNKIHDHSLFIYPFINQTIPEFIGVVPEVVVLDYFPDKAALDRIYVCYCDKVGRTVEGFVLSFNNFISKYVRLKNGKLVDYKYDDRKGE